jgi:hypothetical protein
MRSFAARRSIWRIFRARRFDMRTLRVPRSLMRGFRARRLNLRSFSARRFPARCFGVQIGRRWRAKQVGGIERVEVHGVDWSPVWRALPNLEIHPWNDQIYSDFTKLLEEIPEGNNRDEALKRVERLDCKKAGESLASCDPGTKPPPLVEEWRRALKRGSAPDEAAYQHALGGLFSNLVCGGDASAIYFLRGLAMNRRLEAAGGAAAALIAKILDDKNHCPVSAALTAADKAKLLEIKKSAERAVNAEAAPSPPPAKQPEKPAQPSLGLSDRAGAKGRGHPMRIYQHQRGAVARYLALSLFLSPIAFG